MINYNTQNKLFLTFGINCIQLLNVGYNIKARAEWMNSSSQVGKEETTSSEHIILFASCNTGRFD